MTPPVATDERRPVPAIDPRIRARRIAVRRDRGRRRLHRFTIAAVVAGVAALLVAAALSPLADVDAIEVSGAVRAGRAAVVAASGLERGDPMVTLDAAGAEVGVEGLPWVESAAVRRSWPGTVAVDVVERRPVAGIAFGEGDGAAVALVDDAGRVLEAVAVGDAGVVVVAGLPTPGPPGTRLPDTAAPALTVAGALTPDLLLRTERIVVAGDGVLQLDLRVEDGPPARVVLGDATLLPDKLLALATLLASVDLTDVSVIDLEVPRAPALTRR